MKYTGTKCRCNGLCLTRLGKGAEKIHGPQAERQKSQLCSQKDKYGVVLFDQLLGSQSDFCETGDREHQMITELAKLRPGIKGNQKICVEKK